MTLFDSETLIVKFNSPGVLFARLTIILNGFLVFVNCSNSDLIPEVSIVLFSSANVNFMSVSSNGLYFRAFSVKAQYYHHITKPDYPCGSM
jgi:hypothetical protein